MRITRRQCCGDPSLGVLAYAALFTFFVTEYLYFEEVHLYTYDFMAERVGFKLGLGCLVFYPFFYCVGLWTLAEAPNPHTPPLLLVFWVLLFFAGWMLSTPLLLASTWAFIPAIISVVLLVIRTALEDRTLLEELPGYDEYASRVRFRLIPGVW